jgi:hypothetical protein
LAAALRALAPVHETVALEQRATVVLVLLVERRDAQPHRGEGSRGGPVALAAALRWVALVVLKLIRV